jgi:hypothetical protein
VPEDVELQKVVAKLRKKELQVANTVYAGKAFYASEGMKQVKLAEVFTPPK